MTPGVREQLQSCVRLPALPIAPGETVAAQMRRSWERLGRPAWWRLKACWYGEAGCFSAQAANDMQERYLRWREAESRRAAETEATEKLIRRQHDLASLERARREHLAALAKIEMRLSVLATRGDP